MTLQERCKELLPVIQAGANGAVIQVFTEGKWVDKPVGNNFVASFQYRAKPEMKHRAFNRHEAFDLIDKQIKPVGGCGSNRIIKRLGVILGRPCIWTDIETWIDFPGLLAGYTFSDGSPCGVKECHCD